MRTITLALVVAFAAATRLTALEAKLDNQVKPIDARLDTDVKPVDHKQIEDKKSAIGENRQIEKPADI
jgi:hypothetical protein